MHLTQEDIMLESSYREVEHQEQEDKNLDRQLWPKRKKIMVIDDDVDFRLAISEVLVDNGYSVMTAKDGEMGLNYLVHERELPDLILVDLMMPIKSGLEFRREQIQLEGISDIPVVFVTGYGLVDGELCIQKPFDSAELINQLRKYI